MEMRIYVLQRLPLIDESHEGIVVGSFQRTIHSVSDVLDAKGIVEHVLGESESRARIRIGNPCAFKNTGRIGRTLRQVILACSVNNELPAGAKTGRADLVIAGRVGALTVCHRATIELEDMTRTPQLGHALAKSTLAKIAANRMNHDL